MQSNGACGYQNLTNNMLNKTIWVNILRSQGAQAIPSGMFQQRNILNKDLNDMRISK